MGKPFCIQCCHVPTWVGFLALLAGCQSQSDPAGVGTTVPVEGQLKVGDTPLTTGTVAFHPLKAKGNDLPHTPGAEIQTDGKFRLVTATKPGAPPGWYKVVVVSSEPPNASDPFADRKSFIDTKYGTAETSDLEIEVIEGAAPGTYDFGLRPPTP
jgi:hypothetical protein